MSKLKSLLNTAADNNEFYKNIIEENNISNPLKISEYPILTRKELQENRYKMFSDGYDIKYMSNALLQQSSSGTSGIPIYVYWDYNHYFDSVKSLWKKRLKYYGVHIHNRYVKFTLSTSNNIVDKQDIYSKKEAEHILNINFSAIRTDADYKKMLEIIADFEPEWIYIQPFILNKLLFYYKKFDKTPPTSIFYMECVGEVLLPSLQQQAVEFFKVPVANLYGSEEMNGIAYECPHHQMHIFSNNVLVECMDNNGIHIEGEGQAIITSLTNKTMPLIRYNQGDNIVLKNTDNPCLCGSTEPVITQINGRCFESIKIENTEINSYVLLKVVAEVNNQFNSGIIYYNFVYFKSLRKLKCYIQLADNKTKWFASIEKEIISALSNKINFSDDIGVEVISGKYTDKASLKQKMLIIED